MGIFVALLRAVNVGGTGKLPMAELRALCESLGFTRVQTYIQSGNVVLQSRAGADTVAKKLADALAEKMGKPVGVMVRTADDMAALAAAEPFPGAPPNRVLVFFLPEPLAPGALDRVKVPAREEIAVRGREAWVHYPDGIGASKLVLPFAKLATGRNLATVRALAKLASG